MSNMQRLRIKQLQEAATKWRRPVKGYKVVDMDGEQVQISNVPYEDCPIWDILKYFCLVRRL
jgi:hypothetical protein